jgi:hypothetical protein
MEEGEIWARSPPPTTTNASRTHVHGLTVMTMSARRAGGASGGAFSSEPISGKRESGVEKIVGIDVRPAYIADLGGMMME